MIKTILLAAILAIIGIQPAVAQYQVHTFGRVDQDKVAQDRAAMAAADNAKRVAWAEYQARLVEEQRLPAMHAADALRLKQMNAVTFAQLQSKADMKLQAKKQAQEHQDAIETAAATKAVEDVLRNADTRKSLDELRKSATRTEHLTQLCVIAILVLVVVATVAAAVWVIKALF